jgi:transposase
VSCGRGVFRSFFNRRQFAVYAGLGADALAGRDPACTNKASPKPETCSCEQNDPVAWLWVRHQPRSILTLWFMAHSAQW